MVGLYTPLPTLRRHSRGCLRTAWRQCGSLILHCDGLAPSTLCRTPGAQLIDFMRVVQSIAIMIALDRTYKALTEGAIYCRSMDVVMRVRVEFTISERELGESQFFVDVWHRRLECHLSSVTWRAIARHGTIIARFLLGRCFRPSKRKCSRGARSGYLGRTLADTEPRG
jgi:hypothetical protein